MRYSRNFSNQEKVWECLGSRLLMMRAKTPHMMFLIWTSKSSKSTSIKSTSNSERSNPLSKLNRIWSFRNLKSKRRSCLAKREYNKPIHRLSTQWNTTYNGNHSPHGKEPEATSPTLMRSGTSCSWSSWASYTHRCPDWLCWSQVAH